MSATGQDHQDQAREAQLRRGRELLQEQLRRDEQERLDQQERQRLQREQERERQEARHRREEREARQERLVPSVRRAAGLAALSQASPVVAVVGGMAAEKAGLSTRGPGR